MSEQLSDVTAHVIVGAVERLEAERAECVQFCRVQVRRLVDELVQTLHTTTSVRDNLRP